MNDPPVIDPPVNDPVMTGAPDRANSLRNGPDGRGRFGDFGGRFVAETLMPLILEVERAYDGRQGRPGVPGRTRRIT